MSNQKTPFTQKKESQPSILKEEAPQKKSWTQILIFVLLIYTSMSFMHGCFSILDLKAQENEVMAQTIKAEQKQKELENEVSYLQTEEAIEKAARNDLHMVKPGEILLVQRDKEAAEKKAAEEAAKAAEEAKGGNVLAVGNTESASQTDTTASATTQAQGENSQATTADTTQSAETAASEQAATTQTEQATTTESAAG